MKSGKAQVMAQVASVAPILESVNVTLRVDPRCVVPESEARGPKAGISQPYLPLQVSPQAGVLPPHLPSGATLVGTDSGGSLVSKKYRKHAENRATPRFAPQVKARITFSLTLSL